MDVLKINDDDDDDDGGSLIHYLLRGIGCMQRQYMSNVFKFIIRTMFILYILIANKLRND